MPEASDLSHDFARFVANAKHEDLSVAAVEGAKKSILDTLGVSLAGSGMEPAVRAFVDFAHEAGGEPECSIFGFGHRAPAATAANRI